MVAFYVTFQTFTPDLCSCFAGSVAASRERELPGYVQPATLAKHA